MYQWSPEDYARHSAGQERWARERLAELNLRPDDTILDIGCGDGRITAVLAELVPEGRVVGMDLSADMIAYAQARHGRPNLAFQREDAQAMLYESEFSVVFSNAALHWVKDPQPVLAGIARALTPGGRCFMEMGGRGSAAALISAFEAIAAEPAWRQNFEGFESTYGFHEVASYRHWLREAALDPGRVALVDKDMVHKTMEGFIGWLRTAWHPYTARVPAARRERFIELVAQRYLAEAAGANDGGEQIHVAMVRLQVEAWKPERV
ncbi:class I SAM-dependent methyltransferase [Methyloterricola oryzae]|uniref:class I SAM-dependent methyltransferase n=1 Tax=Methyloterricola oryzae TaxID=1495050 RepID=UPI0005EBBB69|nr:class I SAM-dependent methyltransferase [Methyloterricola oryzae]